MDAPANRGASPSDVRTVRMLASECRMCFETAKYGPTRMRTFIEEGKRHVLLLRAVLDALPDRSARARLCRARAWDAWLASLCAGNQRKVWHHRVAFTNDAIRALGEVERHARAWEGKLWSE